MRSAEIVVLGGGAAGMAASIEAARAGKKVLLLEKMKRPGKKLLATGNGRCNYTNRLQEKSCYRGEDALKAFQVVEKFGFSETVDWFAEIGIIPAERQGYFYPASFQSASVLHALERELRSLNVEIHTEETVSSVSAEGQGKGRQGFLVHSDKSSYLAKKILLSTGGMASPVHGSSGDGFLFAQALGHTVIPPVPALTSLILEGNFMKEWAGNRLQGKVWLFDETGQRIAEDEGEIQLVDYGISGIPVFQVSRFAAKVLAEKREVFLGLDSLPSYSEKEIFAELVRRKNRALHMKTGNVRSSENPAKKGKILADFFTAGDLLEGMLPDKFIKALLKFSSLSAKEPTEQLSEKKLAALAKNIKEFKVRVKAVSGFEKAQVCAGGVPLEEIRLETFESKKVENLFLAGEVLDVDGICGGYNLQWAWSSGILAGRAMGRLSLKQWNCEQ